MYSRHLLPCLFASLLIVGCDSSDPSGPSDSDDLDERVLEENQEYAYGIALIRDGSEGVSFANIISTFCEVGESTEDCTFTNSFSIVRISPESENAAGVTYNAYIGTDLADDYDRIHVKFDRVDAPARVEFQYGILTRDVFTDFEALDVIDSRSFTAGEGADYSVAMPE
jgi:hypothetical protein